MPISSVFSTRGGAPAANPVTEASTPQAATPPAESANVATAQQPPPAVSDRQEQVTRGRFNWISRLIPHSGRPHPAANEFTPEQLDQLDWMDRTSLNHLRRWAFEEDDKPIDLAVQVVSQFCAVAMPPAFLSRLREDPTVQPLGALVAGLVFTASHENSRWSILERADTALGYLEAKNNPKLWNDCQAEAKDATEHCGDRVDYGFNRVEQVIERHKMALGELPPNTVLRNAWRHFNLTQVEIAAQRIALEKNGKAKKETIEVFMSLAGQLAEQGVDMGELPRHGLYTDNKPFRVDTEQVYRVKKELEVHRRQNTTIFHAAFEGDLAVQSALQALFPDDYQAMLAEREKAEDEASEVLLAVGSTNTQRQTARRTLEQLSKREPEWFFEKVQKALNEIA